MKWLNGETKESKNSRKEQWHKWFAWHPVTVDIIEIDGKKRKVKVWLEYVQRIGYYHSSFGGGWWDYTYKCL